jgi:hypothetical protein
MLTSWADKIAVFGLTLATSALACRCLEPKSPQRAYDHAKAVVIAEVIDVRPDPRGDGFAASIAVMQAWKEDLPARLDVLSATTCKFDLQPHGKYLLYLTHDPKMMRGASEETFTTGLCLGNKPLAAAPEIVRWLRIHGRGSSIRSNP